MTAPRTISSAVCLGCGCACDDVTVTLQADKITDAAPMCPVGRAWLGDGTVPSAVTQGGRPVALDEALRAAAAILGTARERLLIYLGTDLTCEAQRAAVALADMLGAVVDTATSSTAATGIVAGQRRGRATATLGEIRNRADLLVFWGVDPNEAYPRFLSRYALDPVGTHVPEGRAGRTMVSVSIGADRGPAQADVALTLDPADEIAALSVMRAVVLGQTLESLPRVVQEAATIAARLTEGKYVVLVHDAEPTAEPRDPARVEGLIALTQALNGPTRAALSSLRAGGNRVGAEAVLTWQTGYPFAVTYRDGVPRYTPSNRGLARLANPMQGADDVGAALIVGSTAGLSADALAAITRTPTVVIGPRASEIAPTPALAIDTGIAGIHEAGTAYRMDDVPLPLRAVLDGPRDTATVLTDLRRAVTMRRERQP